MVIFLIILSVPRNVVFTSSFTVMPEPLPRSAQDFCYYAAYCESLSPAETPLVDVIEKDEHNSHRHHSASRLHDDDHHDTHRSRYHHSDDCRDIDRHHSVDHHDTDRSRHRSASHHDHIDHHEFHHSGDRYIVDQHNQHRSQLHQDEDGADSSIREP